MADVDLARLEAARIELAELAGRRAALLVEVAAAETDLAELDRTAASIVERRAALKVIERLRRDDARLALSEAKLTERIEALRERIRLDAPERSVEQLDGSVPTTLLPVRLETRFADQNSALRIRIFPEQIHVDAHEPELTADELAVAQLYWQQRWAAGADVAARRAAWAQLARVVRPARARWLVQATTPTNLDQLGQGEPAFPATPQKAAPWTRAPVARLLPEQWVALGYRDGVEVLRAWGLPVAETVAVGLAPDLTAVDSAAPPPAEQTTLPIDDGMRWMIDYDAALAAGMAITVTNADLSSGQLADGLDELVVLGVDWSLRPDAAAAGLADQLTRHSVSDGLALLGAGTPTNNTDEARAAPGTDPLLDPAALDPAEIDEGVQGEGDRIGRAMGLTASTAFASVPGHGRFDEGPATDMATALWAPTLGYFLDQMMRPLVSTRTADAVAAHARRWVRARGPFGCLRVGRQPYGVLPVLAGRFESDDAFQLGLARQLEGLRPFWANAAGAVPRLGDSDRPDADLIELLRRTPRSGTFRFREAAGATYTTSILGFDMAAIFQEQLARMLLALAGINGQAEISLVTVRPDHRRVPVPLVAGGELSETEAPEPNFVAAVHANTISTGGFRRLLNDPSTAGSLLEALLRHAASLEFAIGSTLLVIAHELATQVLTVEPHIATLFEREIHGVEFAVDIDGDADAEASLLVKVDGPVELATTRVAAISGGRNLADFLAVTPDAELGIRVETQRFAAFRASLERLAKVPSAELARLAADVLDCASHRLDAWITSVATRRLDDLREGAVTGCHVGGFGYVEDLVPRSAPTSLGYLQAPSVAHAITAAVLRSGHLARDEDAQGALAIDLASTRVSLALELVEGVRRGQPIGALLGYRFERGLRDRRMTLAQYILPIRQLAPLATTAAGPDDGTPVEVIAARDVVDGVLLLRRWKADPDATFGALSVAVPAADRADIELELRRLDDALDAVSDLLMAESVHQAVLGNAERSAAALDALDRQSAVADVGFVRTPRTGSGTNHRLLVLLQAAVPAPGWDGLADPRQAAEPRVDAWAGAVLGNPDRYRFAADVVDADGGVVQTVTARLTDLGLSALGTVCACAASGRGGTTELEERLALRLSAAVTAPGAERLVFRDEPPAGSPASARGLRDLLELGDQTLDLLAGARQADSRALAPDTERPESGVDAGELRARADGAVAALRTAVDALAALPAGAGSAALAGALLALAAAGQRTAVPAGDDASGLATQAATVLSTSAALAAALDTAEAAFDRGVADAAAQVSHDLARLRRVFGESFPALATFAATNGAELAASAADAGLLAGDPLAAATWLTQHALVRPAAARLTGVLTAVEMLSGDLGLEALTVAQVPHRPGERWISLPRTSAAERPTAAVSIVAHSATPIDFTSSLAGLVLDQWSDVVPNDHETTGLSFHFDAPGARAPQTILLAVPGDRSTRSWTVEALAGTVREAMALARIRALDLDDLEAVGRFLPAIYLPFNIESKTPSINLASIIGQSIQQANLAFLAEDG